MAANITFFATDDADWVAAIELIDGLTNAPLADAATATDFNLTVATIPAPGCDGSTLLTASLSDGTITKPDAYTIRWRFTVSQLGALCIGNTYGVGVTMTTDADQVVQLVSGTLVFKDGSRP